MITGIEEYVFETIDLISKEFVERIFQDARMTPVGNSALSESDVWAIS